MDRVQWALLDIQVAKCHKIEIRMDDDLQLRNQDLAGDFLNTQHLLQNYELVSPAKEVSSTRSRRLICMSLKVHPVVENSHHALRKSSPCDASRRILNSHPVVEPRFQSTGLP
jgi:hypothetical protein